MLYTLLGPLSCIILICFENVNFLKNLGFWPSMNTFPFFGVQTMTSFLMIAVTVIGVNNRIDVTEPPTNLTFSTMGEDESTYLLDLFPLYIAWFMVISRYIIISIRHGTSSAGNWQSNSRSNVTQA